MVTRREPQRPDWRRTGPCIFLSAAGLLAVPFVGARFGGWPEALAIAIGLSPLVYIAISVAIQFNSRLAEFEQRLCELARR